MSVERERVFSGDRDHWEDQATPDEALARRVREALELLPDLDPREVRVDSAAGQVTLSGRVPSPEDRGRAAACAGSVEGVVAVRDRLRVAGGLAESPSLPG